MSNAYQDDKPRYIVVEVDGEATAEQFEEISDQISNAAEMIQERGSIDVFTIVPHSYQEARLRELFGEPEVLGFWRSLLKAMAR